MTSAGLFHDGIQMIRADWSEQALPDSNHSRWPIRARQAGLWISPILWCQNFVAMGSAGHDGEWLSRMHDEEGTTRMNWWMLAVQWLVGALAKWSTTTSDGSVTIWNYRSLKKFRLEVQMDIPTKPVNANAFTVVFEQDSWGLVGWMSHRREEESDHDDDQDDDKDGESDDSDDDDPNDNYDEDLFFFDLEVAKFKLNGNQRQYHRSPWSRKLPVTIVCTRNVAANTYSIQVLANDSDERMMMVDTYCSKKQLFPVIYVAGTVTISNVMYAFWLL
jgi:hypothetical protein